MKAQSIPVGEVRVNVKPIDAPRLARVTELLLKLLDRRRTPEEGRQP